VLFAHLAGVALATFWSGLFPWHLERFALLPLFLITNLGEEIGWRGFALPRLQLRLQSSGVQRDPWGAENSNGRG
jgi:membrane protease YdiL (CAAX protease family)